MDLLLVRHGQAAEAATDDARKLTSLGVRQAETVGGLLNTLQWSGSEVWHSTKVRARETAENMAKSSGLSLNLQERSGLRPEDDVIECATAFEGITTNLIVVGHNPFMDGLGGYLSTGDRFHVEHFFSTGSALHLKRVHAGEWKVEGFYNRPQ